MMEMLKMLEPISYEPNELMFDEMEEFTEVVFLLEGEFKIGFRINQKEIYVLRADNVMIGGYNVMFNSRSLFIYRIHNTFV